MITIAVLLVCFVCPPARANEQSPDVAHAVSDEDTGFFRSDFNLDFQAYHEKYYGRSFIHNEEIQVEKEGINAIGANTSESIVYASGICVGEMNSSLKTTPGYECMHDFHARKT